MSHLAADTTSPTVAAYELAEGGAGHESRAVSRKWREVVIPHYCEPASRHSRLMELILDELGWQIPRDASIPVALSGAQDIDWHLESDEMRF